MTTKDEALQMALEALEYSKSYLDELADVHGTSKKAKPGSTSWNVNRAIIACREALAQKDEQALHAGAAVPSEAISLSGDAKLAHDLNCTVFVYRHRETGAIRALYTEDARAMTGRDDYEHVASLEPRMWIEHHFDDAAKERQPLTDAQRYALIEKHLGLEQRKNATVIDHRTGRWTDAARYFDLMDAAIVTAEATGEQP